MINYKLSIPSLLLLLSSAMLHRFIVKPMAIQHACGGIQLTEKVQGVLWYVQIVFSVIWSILMICKYFEQSIIKSTYDNMSITNKIRFRVSKFANNANLTLFEQTMGYGVYFEYLFITISGIRLILGVIELIRDPLFHLFNNGGNNGGNNNANEDRDRLEREQQEREQREQQQEREQREQQQEREQREQQQEREQREQQQEMEQREQSEREQREQSEREQREQSEREQREQQPEVQEPEVQEPEIEQQMEQSEIEQQQTPNLEPNVSEELEDKRTIIEEEDETTKLPEESVSSSSNAQSSTNIPVTPKKMPKNRPDSRS